MRSSGGADACIAASMQFTARQDIGPWICVSTTNSLPCKHARPSTAKKEPMMPTLHPIQISSSWYAQLAVALCCSYSAAAAAVMLALHRTPCAMWMQHQQSHTSPRADHVALNPTPLRGQTMSTAPNGVDPRAECRKGVWPGFRVFRCLFVLAERGTWKKWCPTLPLCNVEMGAHTCKPTS